MSVAIVFLIILFIVSGFLHLELHASRREVGSKMKISLSAVQFIQLFLVAIIFIDCCQTKNLTKEKRNGQPEVESDIKIGSIVKNKLTGNLFFVISEPYFYSGQDILKSNCWWVYVRGADGEIKEYKSIEFGNLNGEENGQNGVRSPDENIRDSGSQKETDSTPSSDG